MMRFEGKVALVTASTQGIGLAIAERLGVEGASVVVCSRKEENVRDAVEHLRQAGVKTVVGLACHVGTEEGRQRLLKDTVERFGRIDVLVSNVATNPVMGSMLEATTERAWDKIFETNVKSHFFLIKDAVPHMPKGSSIIIVSSYAGYLPNPLLGAYSVSKTALLGLNKVLATELAPNIRVNCVAPGLIRTKFSSALWQDDQMARATLQHVLLQRIGEVQDCAGVAAFLASNDAAYITGETVLVSGGIPARL